MANSNRDNAHKHASKHEPKRVPERAPKSAFNNARKHAPINLGLRVTQVVLAVGVFAVFLNAAVVGPSKFRYDMTLVASLTTVAMSVISIWFIHKRASAARPFTVLTFAISAALLFLDFFVLGGRSEITSFIQQTLGTVGVCIVIAVWVVCGFYMALSKTVRHALTRKLNSKIASNEFAPIDLPFRKRIRTWMFWRNLIFYFVVFSFIGHWAEMLFCQLIVLGVFMGDYDPTNAMLWDQWLFPFSAEGIAVALIVLLLYPLKELLMKATGNKPLMVFPLSFLANGIVCTSVDFMTGMVANQDYALWDYRNLPFNFMGQVCLQNSFVYTIVATLIVWVVYPVMDRAIAMLPRWLADVLFMAFVSVYCFLALLHFLTIFGA